MNVDDVTAVIVTRGNVDLDPIFASLAYAGFKEDLSVFVWDNSNPGLTDLGVYGRYAAIEHVKTDVVYVQDDDCIVPIQKVLDAYEPGRLVANMPESRWAGYPDSVMVGWGAVFDRDLPEKAFEIFKRATLWNDDKQMTSEEGESWRRTCDIVFSALTPRTVIDVGFQHLPWAEGPGRMWTSNPDHGPERDRMVELCRRIRTWPDDDRRVPRQP